MNQHRQGDHRRFSATVEVDRMPGAYVDAPRRRRRWPIAGAAFVVIAGVTVGFVSYAQSGVVVAPLIAPIGANATAVYDEFDGPAGQRLDQTLWSIASGPSEGRLQTYTDTQANIALDGAGHLAITALRTDSGYTSARVTTEDAFAFTFGRVEARVAMPVGRGLHPEFRMMSAGAEGAGEIDVLESPEGDGSFRSGIRTGDGRSSTSDTSLPLSDGYHVYWVERRPGVVTTGVDNTVLHRATAADLGGDAGDWVFDDPFYLQFDLAVGGDGVQPTDTTQFPATMSVDWVRTRVD